jgi:hypothetical protein
VLIKDDGKVLMLLTVHTSVGTLIGNYINSGILAFTLSFISHFLLDMIPHGDHGFFEMYYRKGKKTKRMVGLASLDITVMTIFVIDLFTKNAFLYPKIVILGITGSILPDFLIGFSELTKSRPLEKIKNFHNFSHSIVKCFKLSPLAGLFFQVLLWRIISMQI